MFSTDKFLLLFLWSSIHMLYFLFQTVGFQPSVALHTNYILSNAICKLPITHRCYSPKKNPLLPGWDSELALFPSFFLQYPSMTAETPSSVLNQLWETVPTASPAEILRRRTFYRKGIRKCQTRKEIHKLITGRNNFDLSHDSSFQLKLLFLLFVETLIVLLKIKPVMVLENLRFSVFSPKINNYFLCCAVKEYRK